MWRHECEVENDCINLAQCWAKWYTPRRVRVFRKQDASHLLTAMLNFWYLYPTLVAKGATPTIQPHSISRHPSRQILGFTRAICWNGLSRTLHEDPHRRNKGEKETVWRVMYQIQDSNLLTELSTIKHVEIFSLKEHAGGHYHWAFFMWGGCGWGKHNPVL